MGDEGRWDSVPVTLPGGVWTGEVCRRELPVRALTAEDETQISERAGRVSPAHMVTELLSRSAGLSPQDIRALTIGDREALMLHVRRLTIGNDLSSHIVCPAPACGRQMELDLKVSDLLVPPYEDARPTHDVTVDAGGHSYHAWFRLPTGGDQEAAADLVTHDAAAAAALILRRCVQRIVVDGNESPSGDLPIVVVNAISAVMVERDPQAELELAVTCPECGVAFSALFDTAAFFLRELEQRSARLLREIHTLALHYHWSERDILGLPAQRRARYLALLAESLSTPAALVRGVAS